MTPRRTNWLPDVPPNWLPVPGDKRRFVGDSWIEPGEEKRVWCYLSADQAPEEAIAASKRMVAAHELEWIRLYCLTYEPVGKGAYRWAADVLVHLPAVAEPLPEAML